MSHQPPPQASYRGRLAPTPTGYLHLGHARTFWTAFDRARSHGGVLVYRNENLDPDRCRPEFTRAAMEDLRWLGIDWQEGPDVGGPFAPYDQPERIEYFLAIWKRLHATGLIYPSSQSRKDVREALLAPHDPIDPDEPPLTDAEPMFPKEFRPPEGTGREAYSPLGMNWRFRVPDGRAIRFSDGRRGPVERVAGRHFGDFLLWRRDGWPSYELAVVADDHAMRITEVVRGEDLLTSTARQLLVYEALGWTAPEFYHVPLMTDADGKRLAKRHDALSIRALREAGLTAAEVLAKALAPITV